MYHLTNVFKTDLFVALTCHRFSESRKELGWRKEREEKVTK